jgi:hypothetical protein
MSLAHFLTAQAKTLEQIQTSFPLNKSGVEEFLNGFKFTKFQILVAIPFLDSLFIRFLEHPIGLKVFCVEETNAVVEMQKNEVFEVLIPS